MDIKIARVQLYKYEIPLKREILIGKKEMKTRRGMVIRLTGNGGEEGVGEVAPLDGYSWETVDKALAQLMAIKDRLVGLRILEDIAEPLAVGRLIFPGISFYPSVVFGIETAATLLLKNRIKSKSVLAEKDEYPEIEVHGLLDTSFSTNEWEEEKQLDEEVAKLVEQGYSTIKMKVGRGKVEDDIRRVNRVISNLTGFNGKVKLRLDANWNWNYDTALEFASRIEYSYIKYVEFIEEPFRGETQLTDFYLRTGMFVAWDESLSGIYMDRMPKLQGLKAIVLKPTRLGGLSISERWSEWANDGGVKVLASSCFEAGPGLAALMWFILSHGTLYQVNGLDTLKMMEYSLFREAPLIKGGRFSPRTALVGDSQTIYNFDLMTELK